MTRAVESDLDSSSDERSRVAEQLRQRLESRGVLVHSHDSAEDLDNTMEAVERFESAVEARGGDLMMDEPPSGNKAQPDNASFVLPTRNAKETANAFVSRIDAATAQIRAKG
ncbi:MAG: hypothetical protein ABI852_04345 [Gemmatimonadaceae bacterium]